MHTKSSYLYYFQHLLSRNKTVSIEVVHAKRPLELVLELPPRGDAKCTDELPEVYRTVAVLVERAKHMLGELGRVAVRKEVAVDLLELLYS